MLTEAAREAIEEHMAELKIFHSALLTKIRAIRASKDVLRPEYEFLCEAAAYIKMAYESLEARLEK